MSFNQHTCSLLGQQSATPDGSLVITDNQTAGRGQRGNSWHATQGLNFTFSLFVKPSFLRPNQQFYLNIVVALGVFQYLQSRTNRQIFIKWPNDILVEEKKICGILIENTIQGSLIQHSVMGIGLNINQQSFASEKATSLRNITGADYVLSDELDALLSSIEKKYLLLRQGGMKELLQEYYQHLFGMNTEKKFRANDMEFTGTIKGIDSIGRLRVDTAGEEKLLI